MFRCSVKFGSLACLSLLAFAPAAMADPIVSYDLGGPVPTMNVDLNVAAPSNAELHITPDEFQLTVNGSEYSWETPGSDPVYAIAIHGSDHPDDLVVTKTLSNVSFDLLVGFVGYGGNDEFENNTSYTAIAYGGPGNDLLVGGLGVDYLMGDAGEDTLEGGPGDDVLSGGPGADELFGQLGDDLLMGDATLTPSGPAVPEDPLNDGSIDTLNGGLGVDTFIENYYVVVDVDNPYAIGNLLVEQDDVVDAGRADLVLDWEVDMPIWGIEGFPVPQKLRSTDQLKTPQDSPDDGGTLTTRG